MKTKTHKKTAGKKSGFFIVLALAALICAILALIYFLNFSGESYLIRNDPERYIKNCVIDAADEALNILSSHGGFIEPSPSVRMNSTDISVLCYTSKEGEKCLNMHPMLKKEIETGIYEHAKPKIEACFDKIKNCYKNSGYSEQPMSLSAEILPGKAEISINKTISFIKKENEVSLDNFSASLESPIFSFIAITSDIINQEVSCDCGREACNADTISLTRKNIGFEITKPVYSGNGEEIYIIKEIKTGKEFVFAVRNCVRMPW